MSGVQRVTRFSDLDWASELKDILIIGAGGINSYTIFNLSRIGHRLTIFDNDTIDETNVNGGQLYRSRDIGTTKIKAIREICREFGCINGIDGIEADFGDSEDDYEYMHNICIVGVDNMKSRKLLFDNWIEYVDSINEEKDKCLFIDGRLNAELYEVFCICGNDEASIEKYRTEYLFDDTEVEDLPCTAKQTSFVAMGISCTIVGVLCNWLTNRKIGENFRNVPFWQRFFLPLFKHDLISATMEEALT